MMKEGNSKMPVDYARTLRCANAAFSGLMILAVVGASGYVLWNGVVDAWRLGLIIGSSAVALFWGGYYVTFRVRVDAQGVRIRRFVTDKFYAWENLIRADVQESDHDGTAHCCIQLFFEPGDGVRISSSLLDLEEIQALVEDMRHAGILSPATRPYSAEQSERA